MVDKTGSLGAMVDAALTIEKLRVASEVRQTHLFRNGVAELQKEGAITSEEAGVLLEQWDRKRELPELPKDLSNKLHDPETDGLHKELGDLEDYVDGRVAEIIKGHPAYPWFSRVKGVGRENIGKVVAFIDIERAPTVSSLWMYAGFAPAEDGRAMRRVRGEKLRYNSQLRSMCWRLATSLKRAKGKFYEYYIKEKDKYTDRFVAEGRRVLATPGGKWMCLNCGASWAKKGDIAPCCANPAVEKRLRQEPPGVIWLGHLDMMSLRKMIKLFLACLWVTWREAEGLPVREPYPVEKMGHTSVISPWEMTDR